MSNLDRGLHYLVMLIKKIKSEQITISQTEPNMDNYKNYICAYILLLLLWRSIASDEDVSESYGVSAAQSWTRKCDHTGGMQQQPLGQVFFLCGPGAYDRDPANVSF